MRARAAKVFLKAASYIRNYGWQEEGMGEPGQPRCSMGALDSANPQIEWDHELAKIMYETLSDELKGMSLTQYNHKFQNGEKVARLYEQAARKLNHA